MSQEVAEHPNTPILTSLSPHADRLEKQSPIGPAHNSGTRQTNMQMPSSQRTTTSPFRKQALSTPNQQWLGDVAIIVPVSFRCYALLSVALIALFLLLITNLHFSVTEKADGVIAAEKGVIEVYSEESGEVVELLAKAGEWVKKDQVVMKIFDADSQRKDEERHDHLRKLAQQGITAENTNNAAASDDTEQNDEPKYFEIDANYEHTITAPEDGFLYFISALQGEFHARNSPAVQIMNNDELMVKVKVSAELQASLKTGDTVQLTLKALKNKPEAQLKGDISHISLAPSTKRDPVTGKRSHQYSIVIAIDNNSTDFSPQKLIGKLVEVRIAKDKRLVYQWLIDPLKTLFTDAS